MPSTTPGSLIQLLIPEELYILYVKGYVRDPAIVIIGDVHLHLHFLSVIFQLVLGFSRWTMGGFSTTRIHTITLQAETARSSLSHWMPLYEGVVAHRSLPLYGSLQFRSTTMSLLSCPGGFVPSSSPSLPCVHSHLLVEILRPRGFPVEEQGRLSEIRPASSFRFYQDSERSQAFTCWEVEGAKP